MKERPKYTLIGNLGRSIGKNGEIRFIPEPMVDGGLENLKHVFLEMEGQKVPYFLTQVKDDKEIIFKFDDVNSPEDGNFLSHSQVFLNSNDTQGLEFVAGASGNDLIGFDLANQENVIQGEIVRLVEYPHQTMIVIQEAGVERLVPFVEDWILEVDPENRVLYMELPEGLLDEEE